MVSNTLILIISTIAGLLTGVLLLRFWMQAVRVRAPSNLGQFMFAVSNWIVLPLRKVIPSTRGFDWASLLAALLITGASAALELSILSAFSAETFLRLTCFYFVQWICYGFTALLIIEAIFSWVNPHAPLAPFVQALNEPLLRPLRKVIPLIGSVDLSPLVALILLRILLQVVQQVLGVR